MAVIHCKETTNRTANQDAESLTDERVRTWQLLTDNATDGIGVILSHVELPAYFAAWVAVNELGIVTDTEPDIICTHRSAEQTDGNDLMNWTFTARYAGLNPTALPADVESDQVDYQKALIDDVRDRPIVNAAGEQFEAGTMVDRSRGLIRISKNVLEWNAVTMEDYRDTLNDGTMFAVQFPPGFEPLTLKMRSLTAKRLPFPGNQTFYWRATAVIETNLEGWTIKLRNKGLRCIIDGKPRVPIWEGGVTPKGEFLLEVDGTELLPGGAPNFLEFDGYLEVDWTAIPWLEDW